jgi:signal transduction histidine kinase
VFVNLVTNACDAMRGHGTITLWTRSLNGQVVVEVRDTGGGIDDGERDRIFEPFFTTKTMGTGLGLSIVKSIVEAHAGTVQVTSRRGRGSTFSLTLPSGKGSR